MKAGSIFLLPIFKKTFKLFTNHNPLILSAATAFFTTFALSPIIIIHAHILSWLFDSEVMLPRFFSKIAEVAGEKTAKDIKAIVFNFMSLEKSFWVTIAITIFFYFVATTLLSAIRQAIHQIWEIKKKQDKKLLYNIKERAIEVGLVLLIGVLFLLTIGMDNMTIVIKENLNGISPAVGNITVTIFDIVLSIVIVSLWFILVFKILPEAHVAWKVAIVGGLLTGFLFNLGKFLLNKILVHGKLQVIFGHSTSIALLLLFIFYCSFILYYGAAFTFEYAKDVGKPIRPGKLANEYDRKVVEEGK
jgi:membrane protein